MLRFGRTRSRDAVLSPGLASPWSARPTALWQADGLACSKALERCCDLLRGSRDQSELRRTVRLKREPRDREDGSGFTKLNSEFTNN